MNNKEIEKMMMKKIQDWAKKIPNPEPKK